ncbi:MAG: cell wall-active antibiotics response protein, partial [Anaerolineales bacterium]|nr:cell wall-active antibiotics response protein [Anaerolineales bacterium]
QVQRQGDALDVHLQVSERGKGVFMPWNWSPSASLDWRVALNGEVPLALDFETDAGESRLDLTDLRVTNLRVKTEASSTEIDLPAHAGHTDAKIEGGAASVIVRVPAGVAARIQAQGGLSGVSVDLARFPRMGAVYQSEDYASAANRVDLHMDIGLGSVDVK